MYDLEEKSVYVYLFFQDFLLAPWHPWKWRLVYILYYTYILLCKEEERVFERIAFDRFFSPLHPHDTFAAPFQGQSAPSCEALTMHIR